MAKLYLDRSKVAQNEAFSKELLELIEQGIARVEKQASFRSFYDIEIMGISVYFRKNWRYEGVSQEQAKAVAAGS